jgi:hypothetical protein
MAAQYDVPGRSPVNDAETLWVSLSVCGSEIGVLE